MRSGKRVVVAGGGHNGLVCAAYLARAGHAVTVLEKRDQVGGAAVTNQFAPGFRASTASYVVSLLLPDVERDLELGRHGYRVLPRDPASFTPLADGRSLTLGRDAESNRREITQFSARDAQAYPRYEAFLTRVAEAIEPLLLEPPADLLPLPRSWRRRNLGDRWRQWGRTRALYRALAGLGEELPDAVALMGASARGFLDRWFESDVLKATLATDGVIGTFQPPSAAGTAYVLLHHVMGRAGGARGVWGYVQGGMGALSDAIAASARAAGVEIRTGADVRSVVVEGGRAAGVRLANGKVLRADAVVSGAAARTTFLEWLGADDLPPRFRDAVSHIDYSSASFKVNLALSGLPSFSACPGTEAGPQHRGTIHINVTLSRLEQAWADAAGGRPSREPIIEMTLPTALDTSLAPPGRHVANLFVQYAPYALADGDWNGARDAFVDRCIEIIERHAPGFRASVLHREAFAPPDLERRFGLPGGNIFHGALSAHQMFSLRPVPGWSDYRTPVSGLYLCGAAAHPGGGVSGAPGRNAAREILRDLG